MIPLGRLQRLFYYEPLNGVLYWKRGRIGKPAGVRISYGYIQVRVDYKNYPAHKLVWALHYLEWPTFHIHHLDGDKTNNRIPNLYSRTRCGIPGIVPFSLKKWVFVESGRQSPIFPSIQEAVAARMRYRASMPEPL